ncbi:hypothetical protein KFE98_04175 [bacterium SCSIO 12741]|nr:hypothetical protein KFE98_04175 [bacterium SCSIO 12741]
MLAAFALFSATANAQAVSDRDVVPIAVNLNQILRLDILDGGNVEFTFSTIEQYESGIDNDDEYNTRFSVSSSSDWEVRMGSEDATFIGVDDNTHTIELNNVGYTLEITGNHVLGTELLTEMTTSTTSWDSSNDVEALLQYSTGMNRLLFRHTDTSNDSNAGDEADNDFTIHWRCGTTEASNNANDDMNTQSLIDQGNAADRYVTNVIFELNASN